MNIESKYTLDLSEFIASMERSGRIFADFDDKVQAGARRNPIAGYTQSQEKFNTSLGQQIQIYQRVQGAENSLNVERKKTEKQLQDLKARQAEFIAAGRYKELTDAIDKLNARLLEIEKRLKLNNQELDKTPKAAEKISTAFDKIGTAIKTAFTVTGILFVIDKVVELGQKIIEITGTSERYQNQFTRIFEGNGEAAAGYLATLQKTADTTNFTFDELADNVAKLASRGIIPTQQELLKLGDTANFINKPFEQLNEAILDGSNPERWKELGFVVSTQGNKMTLSYGDFTKTVDKSVKGAYDAIQAFAAQGKVLGSTAEAGQTLSGRMSTLADTFAGFFRTLGQGNKGVLNDTIDLITLLVKGGIDLIKTLQPAINAIGSAFGSLISAVGGAITALSNLTGSGEAVGTVAQKIGFYFTKYVVDPFVLVINIAAQLIESFNTIVIAGELAAAKLTGNKGLAATLSGQLAESGKRLKELRTDFGKTVADMQRSLQVYVNADNQRQRREDRRSRLSQEAAENFKPTSTGASQAAADDKKAADARKKALEDENKLLLKAQEDYVKEYQQLQDKFGKENLDALKKDQNAYLLEKARLDKAEVDAEQAHLLKLLQIASSNKTRINKATGQREVVANTSVALPDDIQAQFDSRRAQIDAEAQRQIRLNRVKEEYEILELSRKSYENDLAIFDKYWEQKLLTEEKNSAKYLAMVAKRDRDRNTLVVDQLLTQTKDQESASLSFTDSNRFEQNLRADDPTLNATDVEQLREDKKLQIRIDAGEKTLAFLKEQGERENAVLIAQTQAAVDALKKQQTDLNLFTPKNRTIYDVLGLTNGLNDTQQKAFLDGMAQIGAAIQQTTQLIIEQSDTKIQALDDQINAKQEQVSIEQERDKEGYANNLALRRQELEDLKRQKAEEEAIKKRALAVQQAIDAATQISNSAVAISNGIAFLTSYALNSAKLGPIAGPIAYFAAIASIIASIIAIKAQFKSIVKLRDGGKLKGEKHEQGGIRGTGSFSDIEVEGGEHVTKASMSSKYDKTLEHINSNNPYEALKALVSEGNIGMPAIMVQYMKEPGFGVNKPADNTQITARLDRHGQLLEVLVKNTKPTGTIYPLADGSYIHVDANGKKSHFKP